MCIKVYLHHLLENKMKENLLLAWTSEHKLTFVFLICFVYVSMGYIVYVSYTLNFVEEKLSVLLIKT